MSNIIKQFAVGQTAYQLTRKQFYIAKTDDETDEHAYDKYIIERKVRRVGRKIVTTENGRTFRIPEYETNPDCLVEHTQYSPEYLLFPTRQAAIDHIIIIETTMRIKELANKLYTGKVSKNTLQEIQRMLEKAINEKDENHA